MVTQEVDKADQILDKYAEFEGPLIQILLDVQRRYNYLPKDVLKRISERTGMPLSYIYRVGSFYLAFSFNQRGRHLVDVCLGTACHVRGAPRILGTVEKDVGVRGGETSKDLKYTLRTVRCLGCCAMGPMMVVDGRYYGNLSPRKASQILRHYD